MPPTASRSRSACTRQTCSDRSLPSTRDVTVYCHFVDRRSQMTDVRTAPAEPLSEYRRIRAVVGWAILGAAVTTLAVYGWIRWFVSGDATPISTGVDPVPDRVKISLIVFQVLSSCGAVLAIT